MWCITVLLCVLAVCVTACYCTRVKYIPRPTVIKEVTNSEEEQLNSDDIPTFGNVIAAINEMFIGDEENGQ